MIQQLDTTQNETSIPLPAITALLGSNPITGIAAGVISALQSLGISIKGKTRHLSYDQVLSSAVQFSNGVVPALRRAYTPAELSRLQLAVKVRFLNAMNERWGLGASLNQTIANDISANAFKPDEIGRQLALFVIWVGTNVDAESTTEYMQVFDAYFSEIFLRGISDAGLNISKLKGETTIPVPNTLPNDPPITTGDGSDSGMQKAGMSPFIILVIAGIAYSLYAGKGKV
ncbi:MAG: hypothetical protein WC716_16835 [Chitinophagaceae bacterium]|jgi:hypothetical protein